MAACATQPEANPGSYTLGRGLVTYDALKIAKDKCVAAGGTVRPYTDGGDQYQLSNYHRLAQTIKGFALMDFVGAFGLALKYMWAPKKTRQNIARQNRRGPKSGMVIVDIKPGVGEGE
eukprot:gene11985-11779_t